ncbi:YggT family protein [Streptococcus dentasini]
MIFIIIVCHRLIEFLSLVLVIYALLSWFPGARESQLGRILDSFVEPILRPFRRLPLQFAGLDFTIVVVLFLLQLLDRLIAQLILFV